MTVIKRYPNRKLYNTETKKYITLDGIAKLIREQDEVQVFTPKSKLFYAHKKQPAGKQAN